jgi:hypothetical protein
MDVESTGRMVIQPGVTSSWGNYQLMKANSDWQDQNARENPHNGNNSRFSNST